MTTPEIDEVVALGGRLGAALRREADLDARSGDAGRAGKLSAETYLSNTAKHVTDEIYALRDALSFVKATSLAGAAIQIVEALLLADRVWDQFPKEHETLQLERDARSIDRLLYSALDAIERLTGQKIEDVVGDDYVSRHCNPWLPVEGRCKELTTRAAS